MGAQKDVDEGTIRADIHSDINRAIRWTDRLTAKLSESGVLVPRQTLTQFADGFQISDNPTKKELRYPEDLRGDTLIEMFDPLLVALLQAGTVWSACFGARQFKPAQRNTMVRTLAKEELLDAYLERTPASETALVENALTSLQARTWQQFSTVDFPQLRQLTFPGKVLPVRPSGPEVRLLFDILSALRNPTAQDQHSGFCQELDLVQLSEHEIATVVSQLVLRFGIDVDWTEWPGRHQREFVKRYGPSPAFLGLSNKRPLNPHVNIRFVVTSELCATTICAAKISAPPIIPADIVLALPPRDSNPTSRV